MNFPGFGIARTVLARSLIATGSYEEAIRQIELGDPLLNKGLLGMSYGLLGRTREAGEVLDKLMVRSQNTHVGAVEFVHLYIGLGDEERALDWLERAYEERGIFIAWMKTWPLYDPLRDEPRFEALLAQMQFPNESRSWAGKKTRFTSSPVPPPPPAPLPGRGRRAARRRPPP